MSIEEELRKLREEKVKAAEDDRKRMQEKAAYDSMSYEKKAELFWRQRGALQKFEELKGLTRDGNAKIVFERGKGTRYDGKEDYLIVDKLSLIWDIKRIPDIYYEGAEREVLREYDKKEHGRDYTAKRDVRERLYDGIVCKCISVQGDIREQNDFGPLSEEALANRLFELQESDRWNRTLEVIRTDKTRIKTIEIESRSNYSDPSKM